MKKSKLLLVSWILSVAYLVYLIAYFSGVIGSTTDTEQAAATVVFVLIMPHLFLLFLGLIFNVLGWAMNKRGFALTGAILYSVSMFLFIPYFFFVVIQTILSFIAYAKMKKPVLVVAAV
jgi:hypothetical protein